MVLDYDQARKFYDRFGRKQDDQAFYEDGALQELVNRASFASAASVFEFGCGTGRFAERLLGGPLPEGARYSGTDLSSTMVAIATERLAPFGRRAQATQSSGEISFPLPDASVDRVISTYVLDLLADEDIKRMIAESRRVLKQGGLLCLVSLAPGGGVLPRIVSFGWKTLFRVHAPIVGGCRPIRLAPYLQAASWQIECDELVVEYGITSEVLVAALRS